MTKKPRKRLYLVRNIEGVSLEIAGGPFANEREREKALIDLVADAPGLSMDGADTAHALNIVRGKPAFADYAGGYMENIRWVAGGCKRDERPSTWNTSGFALVTRKSVERLTNRRCRASLRG